MKNSAPLNGAEQFLTLHKKWSFTLRISSVNVTKFECISQSLNNMKRNEEAGNSLSLHFHFNVLSNCQLKFSSFISTIKIIFPSTKFDYLWRYWYFFHCSWHHFRFSWITQTVPFRLSTCGQFKLYSVLQVARTCHFEAIIFWN